MAADVESALRTRAGYSFARQAITAMEEHGVWPTPLNFELWMHMLADPEGTLAHELKRLLTTGDPFTDEVSEQLAAAYLPKVRLNEQIRDAGDQLTKELAAVSKAINEAQRSNEAYGEKLEGASRELVADIDALHLQEVVSNLSEATDHVRRENLSLEKRLAASTAEVSRLKEHLEQVRREATTDGLTNLANRKAFDEELERACADADARGESLVLAVLDIDHFKNFNDTWGHQTGDQVIRYVASVIGRIGAPPRFAARFGGEEFAMLFPRESAPAVAETLEDIRLEVSSRTLKRRATNEDLGAITLSAGYAERRFGESPHAALERADEALYVSKRTGRNRVTGHAAIADAA